MKPFYMLLKNLKNLVPYFLLIAVYFFFINLEAKKDINNNRTIINENKMPINKFKLDNNQMRIEIPVIPYEE